MEPLANYSVLRAQQDLRGGQAGFSVIATAVNRSLDDRDVALLHRDAYTTGATFRNRFGGARFELAAQIAGSYVAGSTEAILATQRDPAHYFQQPDDDSRSTPTVRRSAATPSNSSSASTAAASHASRRASSDSRRASR